MPTLRETTALAVARELLDGSRDELLALDGDGKIVEANAAAAARLGRPRVYLLGKPFAALVALQDRTAYRTALRDAGAHAATLQLTLDDGRQLAATLRALPVAGARTIALQLSSETPQPPPPAERARPSFDLDGFLLRLPHGVVAIDRRGRVVLANQSARRMLAPARLRTGSAVPGDGPGAAIGDLAERLTRVRAPLPARTVEHAGRILRVSGTPAHGDDPALLQIEDVTNEWRADQQKRDFIRNAAHQLRTPLAAIVSAIDVLESVGDDEEARARFLGHLKAHANRLARLTRGLLVLARIDAGQEARLDLVELHDALAEVAAAAAGDIRVECPREAAAIADPDLLQEAVAALVENAVKHTSGAVSITVRMDDPTVSITVADDGPGILPEHRTRVLEPFFRVAADGDGFGLGLSIAARAAEAMGGELTVEGQPGGSRFTVHLRSVTVVR